MDHWPFSDLPPTPVSHFYHYVYAAAGHVIDQVARAAGSRDAAFDQFRFLAGYDNLVVRGGDAISSEDDATTWRAALEAWEETTALHLPLAALREAAGLDHRDVLLLATVGLIEEDARFGALFEIVQRTPGRIRPTFGLLTDWWSGDDRASDARAGLRRLQDLGVIQVVNADQPRPMWMAQIPPLIWDAITDDAPESLAPWARHRAAANLPSIDDVVGDADLPRTLTSIATLLAAGDASAIVVRGPQRNGRRTTLGALARTLDRGLLEISGLARPDDERWKTVGPLATLLRAMPVLRLDLAPGETFDVPRLTGYDGPIGIVCGPQGGLSGSVADRSLTLTLGTPGADARTRQWRRGLGAIACGDLDAIGDRFRMTAGNIHRAADLARSHAVMRGGSEVTLADAQHASRALNRQSLDTLAVRIETSGDWGDLAVADETARELSVLEQRCRHRERLHAGVGAALGRSLNCGVRAIFSGPSGTGKTLAARLLAAALQMDLYRLDLSSVVNKYIGETEKNLNLVFSRAEELDVVLLLDEGDALLSERTAVQTSNDRYANLETNFLLQRLEAYEGILIVTTNAGERIDSAFERRMDVVVPFRPPEPIERWTIWHNHLPIRHDIPPMLIDEIAHRCDVTGGQIRNAVLHASLLALADGRVMSGEHLEAAVQREYRKIGALCPLRTGAACARQV